MRLLWSSANVTSPLHSIPLAALRALAASLRTGPLSLKISRHAVSQIVGLGAVDVEACLLSLHDAGMTPEQTAIVVEAIAESKELAGDPGKILELVISGPDVPGVPTSDTAATMRTLIAEATKEILLVGYVVHHARDIFEPLSERMAADRRLRVVFCIDISRKPGDTSLDSEIVRRFARDFRDKHWPWSEVPSLYYDPRSLSDDPERRSSLHAKCLVADRRIALITSANFTQAAQQRNIEVGLLTRHAPLIERLCTYFERLIGTGQLAEYHLTGPDY